MVKILLFIFIFIALFATINAASSKSSSSALASSSKGAGKKSSTSPISTSNVNSKNDKKKITPPKSLSKGSLKKRLKSDRPGADLEEAILNKALSPNSFNCDDIDTVVSSIDPNQSIVKISKNKLKELSLKDGDVVLIRCKKRRESIATVSSVTAKSVSDSTIFITQRVKTNLRIRVGDVLSLTKLSSSLLRVAKSVTLSPYVEDIQGGAKLEESDFKVQFFTPHFSDNGDSNTHPLHLEDTFVAASNKDGRKIEFKVTAIEHDVKEKNEKGKEEEDDAETPSSSASDFCIVGPTTEIIYEEDEDNSRLLDPRLNEVGYDDIGGCRKQLAAIRELVELPLRHPEVFTAVGIPPPRGVLLHGPSGTGKTSLARAVAAETGAFFYVLNGPEIMSKQSGESESNLRKAFEEAERNSPAIIFIDEIDSIAPKRDKAGGEVERRIVSQLLTLFDGIKKSANVVVIAATNRPNVIDPALRRFGRFDRELLLAQPEMDGRLEILRIKTRDMKIGKDVDMMKVAMDTHGYVGADLSAIVMEAAFAAIREIMPHINIDEDSIDQQILNAVEIRTEHFDHAVSVTNPSSLRESIVEVPDTTWADIGGLEEVKRELQEMVKLPIEYSELYEKFGTGSSKGVLMYGPPGCGKTLLAKAIANECGANFISIKGPELLDAHIGESEANIRALFDKARAAAPCILFFDEMDSIAKARGGKGGGGSGIGDNVINQILTEIDSVESRKSVFVIGATNRPDILDSSIMRPGHLDQLVYIPLPDLASRTSIFKANLRKCPVDDNVDVDKLAKATEGFSGADITEICQRAAKNAIREDIAADIVNAQMELEGTSSSNKGKKPQPNVNKIRRDHFEEAMSRARRSVSDAQIEQYKTFIKKQKNDASSAVDFKFKEGVDGGEVGGNGDGQGEGDEKKKEDGDNSEDENDNLYG